jgi:hypothetical protein
VSKLLIGLWKAAIACISKIIRAVGLHNWQKSVQVWFDDPAQPDRQFGWVREEVNAYVRPVRRIAVRCRKENGQWGIGVIVSNREPKDVLWLTGHYRQEEEKDEQNLLAYVHFYDQRSGTIEIEIKEDKQGLSTTKRSQKRFAAQQILTQLEVLAHNTLIWMRQWLATHCPRLAHFGPKRWVRDILHLNGVVVFDQRLHLIQLILNPADPWLKSYPTAWLPFSPGSKLLFIWAKLR